MRWLLVELLPLLLGSAALGIGLGYVLWRWRRQRIPASAWNDLNHRIRAAESELADAHAELDDLDAELRTAERAIEDARSDRIDELVAELDAEQRAQRDLESDVERLTSRNRQLEASLYEAKKALARVVVDEAEFNQLRRRVRDLETEIRTLRAQRSRPEPGPAPTQQPADRWSHHSPESS